LFQVYDPVVIVSNDVAFLFLFSIVIQLVFGDQPCESRDFGYGGTVCICNATYCDDFDDLPDYSVDEIDKKVLITSTRDGLRHDVSKLKYGTVLRGMFMSFLA